MGKGKIKCVFDNTLPFLTSDYIGLGEHADLSKTLPLLLVQHSGQQRVLKETASTGGCGSAFQHVAESVCPRVPKDKSTCQLLVLKISRSSWDEGLRNRTWEPSSVEPLARIGLFHTKARFDLKLLDFTTCVGKLKCEWEPNPLAKDQLLLRVNTQTVVCEASQRTLQPPPPGPWNIIPADITEECPSADNICLYFLFPSGATLFHLGNGGFLCPPEAQNHMGKGKSKGVSDKTLPFLTSDYVGQGEHADLSKTLPLLLVQHSGQQRVLKETEIGRAHV